MKTTDNTINNTNANVQKIAGLTNASIQQVEAVLKLLLEEQATIPFIARYRKERTGGMDELQITEIRNRWTELDFLEKRRTYVLGVIEEQGKLTPELERKIKNAATLNELEDLYLPYKPKRRTKAMIAREKGLEPLAKEIYKQRNGRVEDWAKKYIDKEKGVENIEEALEGAKHIIAEWVSEDSRTRSALRRLFKTKSYIHSRVVSTKTEVAHKFKDYFDYSEKTKTIPSHRLLALLRGQKEAFLILNIKPEIEDALRIIDKFHLEGDNESTDEVAKAIEDAYKRLLKPSLETEIKNELKERADKEAITVFSSNLEEILLAAPFGEKRVMAIDPGFRTGCKLVCLGEQGQFLEYSSIFPHTGKAEEAKRIVLNFHKKHKIEAIAIGNGTAGRETKIFIESISEFENIPVVFVNESGASIYSASEVARDEFPDLDLTIRGAISIGRRLQDPLAEIVKVDPKSIGVGQYQHDVNQNLLKEGLSETVVNIVNKVGVDVNTASKQLLTYVSGLGSVLAGRVVEYRNENGPFPDRATIKKVKGLGPKAFQQAAGFLRIRAAKNPLDSSAVHPERYKLVKKMAKDLSSDVNTLIEKSELRQQIDLKKYESDDIGMFTLKDIMEELAKPGRDPRAEFKQVEFNQQINSMEDLKEGMILSGVITNVTKFGAFVDIGVHQDGLVHISQLVNRFVKDPLDVVKVNQQVKVKVLDLDIPRKRINLSMKDV